MKLMAHQTDALDRTKNFNRCAYYHDMGLGKTFTGSEKLASLGNDVNLVICQKSKVNDWLDHFKKYYPQFTTYDLTKNNRIVAFIKSESKRVGVINYELSFRRKDLFNLKQVSLMLDESQYVQNEKTKTYKFVKTLDKRDVVLLSGTPTGGKYERLWTQCNLLGWKISKSSFWDRYVEYRLWNPAPMMPPIKLVTGYKNVDELKENLRKYGADFLKTDEVLTLPEQVFSTIKTKPNGCYAHFVKTQVLELDGETWLGDTPLKALLYSRRLCGSYSQEKLSAFREFLDSTEERVIVFYNFDAELEQLKRIIKDRPISEVNGHTKDLTAYETEPNSVTLVQYQSGATGLNLQKARHIAYFTLPLSSNLYEQSKKRIHRIGQKETCFYYLFICEYTVEEHILETLDKYQDYNEELFRWLK